MFQTCYTWETGETVVFPNDFKMVASDDGKQEQQEFYYCVGSFECERNVMHESENTSFPR